MNQGDDNLLTEDYQGQYRGSVTFEELSKEATMSVTFMHQTEVLSTNDSGSIILEQQPELHSNQSSQSVTKQWYKCPVLVRQAVISASLVPSFNPFSMQSSNQLKLRSDICNRLVTVTIKGVTMGRNETNTVPLQHLTKVSGRHARVLFSDNRFMLQDLGSKRGTFSKVTVNQPLQKKQVYFIGDKFAMKVLSIQQDRDEEGEIHLSFDREKADAIYTLRLQKGESWTLGADKSRNSHTLDGHPCSQLTSGRHLQITYQTDWQTGRSRFYLDDLNSRNGTWLRLSDKQFKSDSLLLQPGCKFNLAFEVYFEVVELFLDT